MRDLGDAGEPQGIAAQGKERAQAEFKFPIPYTQGPLPTPALAPKSPLKDHICVPARLCKVCLMRVGEAEAGEEDMSTAPNS